MYDYMVLSENMSSDVYHSTCSTYNLITGTLVLLATRWSNGAAVRRTRESGTQRFTPPLSCMTQMQIVRAVIHECL